MTDEDLTNDEELEDAGVEEEDDADDADDALDGAAVVAKVSEAEALEDFSIASRQKIRDELENQIAAFLARGGKINEVPANVTSDPPKKPTPDYGGRPI